MGVSEGGSAARALSIALLAVLGLTAFPSAASAYKLGGDRWPGTPARITYYDDTPGKCAWSISQAALAWNASGAKLRWIKTSSRSRAGVVISHRAGGFGSQGGFATLGYWAPGTTIDLYGCAKGEGKYSMTFVVAHEMGHIVGLSHVRQRCGPTMVPVLNLNCYEAPKPWLYNCRYLARDDIAGAVSRYGGTVRVKEDPWCQKAPPPKPLSSPSVKAVAGNVLVAADVAFTTPRSSRIKRVTVSRRRNTCPTSDHDGRARVIWDKAVSSGRVYRFKDGSAVWGSSRPRAGTYCYRFSAKDRWGRAKVSTRTVLLLPPPPLAPVSNVAAVQKDGYVAVSFDVGPGYPFDATTIEALVDRGAPTCATTLDRGSWTLRSVPVGSSRRYTVRHDYYERGFEDWCFSVFLADGFSRVSEPVTVVLEAPDPPGPPTNVSVEAGQDPDWGPVVTVSFDVTASEGEITELGLYAEVYRSPGTCISLPDDPSGVYVGDAWLDVPSRYSVDQWDAMEAGDWCYAVFLRGNGDFLTPGATALYVH